MGFLGRPLESRHSWITGGHRWQTRPAIRLGPHQVAIILRRRKLPAIDQSGLGEKFLRHRHRLNRLFDFPFEIVTLVNHVRDVGLFAGFPLEVSDLVEDPKDLVRIDGAESQSSSA